MTTATANWNAAGQVAEKLGLQTRKLVAARNADDAIGWALQMASAFEGGHSQNGPRAATYLELAVLLGYTPPVTELAAEEPDDDEEMTDDDD